MSSNLTLAGWLLLLVSILVVCAAWYVVKIVLAIDIRTIPFFIIVGPALIGGGGFALTRCGIEIMK